jgi:diguanylate cyclase (GGDEF)-like protein
LNRREAQVEMLAALVFVVLAAALALLLPSERSFDPALAVALVASHACAARISLHVGAGYAVPTQVVLVPMLFLVPIGTVPALVACSAVIASGLDVARGRAHPERLVTGIADGWHAFGSTIVIALSNEPGPQLSAAPALAAALVAQSATDLVSATAREWLGRGIAPGLQLRVMASVQATDVCLTPIGLLAALVSADWRFGFALVLPLLPLLGALASDRRARIEEISNQLDELSEERARLDAAIRRIGDAMATRLDRVALAQLAASTALEALDAARGRVVLGSGHVDLAPADGHLEETMNLAVQAARQRRATAAVGDGPGRFALACPLGSESDEAPAEVLVVARSGQAFSPDEQVLFGYLAGQARVAMENVALHDRLLREAMEDDLTGLANHRRFQEVLAHEAKRSQRSLRPLTLIMFDIDDFKAVNDSHGHQQGDAVLREVAKAIQRHSRNTDHPARYGGEELAVVLPETDLDGGMVAAEEIRRAIESLEVPLPDGSPLRVTVSAGVSQLLGDPGSLVAAADAALYEAKRRGKNQTVPGEAAGHFAAPAPSDASRRFTAAARR